jgi:hypothetical protein
MSENFSTDARFPYEHRQNVVVRLVCSCSWIRSGPSQRVLLPTAVLTPDRREDLRFVISILLLEQEFQEQRQIDATAALQVHRIHDTRLDVHALDAARGL